MTSITPDFNPKLAEVIPELTSEAYRLRSLYVLSNTEEKTQVANTGLIGNIQSNLFLAIVSLWILRKKAESVLIDIKRYGIEGKQPNFRIEKPVYIFIPYNNGEKYYLFLQNLLFYGFQEADYRFNAEFNSQRSITPIQDNNKKLRFRRDKIWKLRMQIRAKSIIGECSFKILDELQIDPLTSFGEVGFKFLNLEIINEIQLIEIDRNFVKNDVYFTAPNVSVKINYERFIDHIQFYPTKYFRNDNYYAHVKQIINDFKAEKMNTEQGKTELSKRLSYFITNNLSHVVSHMKSKFDLFHAIFIANNIEPVPDYIKRRFENY